MSKYTAKSALRVVKNYTRGYSDIQAKIREATSNDPWGPSGTLMHEIAQYTFNEGAFPEIMDMLSKRLNDKGKNWRHVFKALNLLDYCLHVGSEMVISYMKENSYLIKTLRQFQHIDENGKDVGANVRLKAKDIVNLIEDEPRLLEERKQRKRMLNRMTPSSIHKNSLGVRSYTLDHSEMNNSYRQSYLDEDRDLQRAIEESKQTALEHEQRMKARESFLEKYLDNGRRESKDENETIKKQADSGSTAPSLPVQYDIFGSPVFGNSKPIVQSPQPLELAFQPYVTPQNSQANPGHNVGYFDISTGAIGFQNMINTQWSMNSRQSPHAPLSLLHQNTLGVLSNSLPQAHSLSTPVSPQSQPNFQEINPFKQYNGHAFSAPTSPVAVPPSFRSHSFSISSMQNREFPFNQTAYDAAISMSTTMQNPCNAELFAQTPHEKYAQLDSIIATRNRGVDTFGNMGDLRIPSGTGFKTNANRNGSEVGVNNNPFDTALVSSKPAPITADLLGLETESSMNSPQFTEIQSNNTSISSISSRARTPSQIEQSYSSDRANELGNAYFGKFPSKNHTNPFQERLGEIWGEKGFDRFTSVQSAVPVNEPNVYRDTGRSFSLI
ncbi:uncharacterized protein VTP21DRAFT_10515 [Calcarisporiella thermophila]|uniref:uncharacterized protein n=1 Tax=Calcarisporiella thermophila TaxID=911321 RepID=UPI00374350C8